MPVHKKALASLAGLFHAHFHLLPLGVALSVGREGIHREALCTRSLRVPRLPPVADVSSLAGGEPVTTATACIRRLRRSFPGRQGRLDDRRYRVLTL